MESFKRIIRKRIILIIIFCVLIIIPVSLFASDEEVVFKAKVIEILEQNDIAYDDGTIIIQQKIRLEGLEGDWQDQEVIFDGTMYEVLSSPEYKEGDKVIISYSQDMYGGDNFYIIGFVRQQTLYWLAALFALVVVLIGRLKGLRALIVLFLTFIIILKFIVPKILAGSNPLMISIIGSLLILGLAIYITEGFKLKSTIAIGSILISLLITALLSIWFTAITKLTGYASDEAIYLTQSAGAINLEGLLLAGILIGALGVLDDVVIAQVSLVEELHITNPDLPKYRLYSKAMKVGVSHLSSMVNTLFLAYTGSALPLIMLFGIKEPPFLTFGQVLNNEIIATEVVRTLTGSIGLVLAVPIATLLAVQFIPKMKKKS